MKRSAALVLFVLWAAPLRADPADAVVMISSHGGSGTVIKTGEGYSYILTCSHLFKLPLDRNGREQGWDQRALAKKIVIDAPLPKGWPRPSASVGCSIIDKDFENDLALLKLNWGPLPYVAAVAPRGPGRGAGVLSVGFDSMKKPPRVESTIVVAVEAGRTLTREHPWPGRSGGGLLDGRYLVGVVVAYESDGNGNPTTASRGIHVGYQTVVAFLQKNGLSPADVADAKPPQKLPYVNIPRQYRTANATGKQCVWVSLATLAKYYGVNRAADLGNYDGSGNPDSVRSVLEGRRVKFVQITPKQMSKAEACAKIKEACDRGYACMVGFSGPKGQHALICCGIGESKAWLLDNMDPELEIREWPLERFEKFFDGWAVCLWPDQPPTVTEKQYQSPPQRQYQFGPALPCPGGT